MELHGKYLAPYIGAGFRLPGETAGKPVDIEQVLKDLFNEEALEEIMSLGAKDYEVDNLKKQIVKNNPELNTCVREEKSELSLEAASPDRQAAQEPPDEKDIKKTLCLDLSHTPGEKNPKVQEPVFWKDLPEPTLEKICLLACKEVNKATRNSVCDAMPIGGILATYERGRIRDYRSSDPRVLRVRIGKSRLDHFTEGKIIYCFGENGYCACCQNEWRPISDEASTDTPHYEWMERYAKSGEILWWLSRDRRKASIPKIKVYSRDLT